MVRVNAVLNVLAFVILVFEGLMVVPWGVSLYLNDGVSDSFFKSIGLTLLFGYIFWRHTRRRINDPELQVRDGFLLAALTWAVAPVFASLPFMFYLPELSFADAYFEAVSGLTTTGATVLSDLDKLPYSINFWRCFMNWFGGMGVVVLSIAILPLLGVGGSQAFKAETPGPMKDDKLTPRIAQTAKGLWSVYSIITIACIGCFVAVGMPFDDALLHAFSTMGLGGFSSHDSSFGYFNSPAMEAVCVFFMLLAGINFATHFLVITRRSIKPYIVDKEAHAFLLVMLFSVLIITYFLWRERVYPDWITAFRYAAFNVVSIATTTGLATTDFNLWPAFAPVWMLFLCCFSTAAGSTGGGIKMVRAQLLLKQSYAELRRLVHPRALIVVKLNGRPIGTSVLYSILAFVLLYGATIIACTMLMLFSGADVVTGFTAVIACINSTGPGLNQVGPATTYAVLTDFQIWICSIAMLLGRLELFTIFVVFSPDFWRR
ncbi:MAG: TrkH family potassium uptake protein [Burkholderiaceae bacterium]